MKWKCVMLFSWLDDDRYEFPWNFYCFNEFHELKIDFFGISKDKVVSKPKNSDLTGKNLFQNFSFLEYKVSWTKKQSS